jgi:tRNA(Ile2)-agmatinylcytidine synthase
LAEERSALVEDLWSRLRAVAPRVRRTDPALVASERPLPARLYWDAVRTIVPIRPVVEALDRWGVTYRHRGSLRGLIGASAALAWPSRRVTWELLAYRAPDRWGSPRRVSRSSVRAAQRKVPELFLCDDPRTRRLLIAPHTACPILYGLRGTTPAAPLAGQALVRSEPVDRWMLFRTNQATGDHLVRRAANRIAPYESAVVEGTVCADPVASPGGHVRFELQDRGGASLTCLAFEPTKVLPKVARGLRVGDRVRVWGSRGKAQGLRLEGIRLVRLPSRTSLTKPHCGRCDRPARSLGRSRGYWCPGCHRRWPPEAAQRVAVPAPFPVGEYHPTPSARRHLHPLAPEA